MIKYSQIVRNRGKYISYIDRKTYRLEEDLRYWVDYNHKNEYIDIPKGYIFDFNSSPCFAHCIVDRDQFVISLVHDYLYSREGKIKVYSRSNLSTRFKYLQKHGFGFITGENEGEGKTNIFLYNRKFADNIWLSGAVEESREIEGVDRRIQACIGYIGIRVGGSGHFKQ